MYKKIISMLLMIFAISSSDYAYDMNSPIGTWINVDDATGQKLSLVKISQQNGTLSGKVVHVFPGSYGTTGDACTYCEGNLKNQPIKGMTVLWGFTPNADGTWLNGKVLNPATGEVNNRRMKLINNGQQMEFNNSNYLTRRTITWVRAD